MFAKFSRWLLILVVGLMVFNVVGQMAAQDDDTPVLGEIELIGAVEALDDSTVTIAGQVFAIAKAEIKVVLVVGQSVKVQGWILNDGSFVAREIEDPLAIDDNNNDNAGNDNSDDNGNDNTGNDNSNDNGNDNTSDDDDAEIVGIVTEITTNTITVGGQVINIQNAEMDDVVVGEFVKVHLRINADGKWQAREVDNDDDIVAAVPNDCVVNTPAGWTSYTIRSGDTLSGIAARAGTSLASLTRANCIQDTRLIVAGTTLIVPRTPVASSNSNDNRDDDNGNDNRDDDGDDDNGNDNDDDGNDNGNDNRDDNGNDNGDDRGGDDNDDDDDDNRGRGGDDDDDDDDSNDND